jgi:hypothetical protein
VEFWKETFENDPYVMKIIQEGYQISVKMTSAERSTRYRECINQSTRNKMDFVRKEVARLVEGSQVIKVDSPPTCVNPLSGAFKVNGDGSIKKRLVIDLSRWVNKFVVPDKHRMARFQDALAQTLPGDYQRTFDIKSAYHHLRLAPESYDLVGFCVENKQGVEEYHRGTSI